jgi:SAM-dependent methyltransferase
MSLLHRARHLLGQAWLALGFRSSQDYWEKRYSLGMTSGSGSAGKLARFKADVINRFVRENSVESVIEFGCGDGLLLELAEYPKYLGIDVSRTAIELCRRRFSGDASKSFLWLDGSSGGAGLEIPRADLTLSLDVLYHLVEDDVYGRHLDQLFRASRRHVIIYSSSQGQESGVPHVRHRDFLRDVHSRFPDFTLVAKIDNPYRPRSFADFYFFSRAAN